MAGTERTRYRAVMRFLSSVFAPTVAATMAAAAAAVGKGKPGRKEEREREGPGALPSLFPTSSNRRMTFDSVLDPKTTSAHAYKGSGTSAENLWAAYRPQ